MTSLENKQISLFPYPSVSSSLPPLFLPIILPLLPPSSSSLLPQLFPSPPPYPPLPPSLGPATAPASRRTGPARPACPPERPRPLAWGEGEAAVPATGSPVEGFLPSLATSLVFATEGVLCFPAGYSGKYAHPFWELSVFSGGRGAPIAPGSRRRFICHSRHRVLVIACMHSYLSYLLFN